MLNFLERPELYGRPIRLSDAELGDPYQVLEDFFCDFSFKQLKPVFEEMVETCLTTDNVAFGKPEQRADLLYIYKRVEMVLEAVLVVLIQRKQEAEEDGYRPG